MYYISRSDRALVHTRVYIVCFRGTRLIHKRPPPLLTVEQFWFISYMHVLAGVSAAIASKIESIHEIDRTINAA